MSVFATMLGWKSLAKWISTLAAYQNHLESFGKFLCVFQSYWTCFSMRRARQGY